MPPLPLNRLYLSHNISEPAFGATADEIFYLKTADGRRSIVRQTLSTGLAQVITTEPMPGGSVGYGNAAFAVRGNVLVYAAKGGQLHGLDLTTGEQWPITPVYEGVAAPVISPCGQFVAFLGEHDKHCNVYICDVRGQALPLKLSDNPWYAFNPTFAPDGTRIAWQAWNENDMPWDEARLHIVQLAQSTHTAAHVSALWPIANVATLSQPRISYAAPQFSPDSQHLAYTSDESGWRSLWIAAADGQNPVRVDTGAGEVGGPDWVPGLLPFCWADDGAALFVIRRCESRHTLVRVAWPALTVTDVPVDYTALDGLALRGATLACLGSTPAQPPSLITIDSGAAVVRASSSVGLVDVAALSAPQVMQWQTEGDASAWGIFYPAVGPEAAHGPRPLMVQVHGGPTSEVALGWSAQAQYFATRGWHVLVINHRGGTGFGRAYQELLTGQWGVVDVEDARTGAEHLIASGLVDAQRAVITGGSAGGYTTLMALTQDPAFWAAGVSLFGIGDLFDLRKGSHRFEVNYELNLIGPLPATGALWKARSPLTHVKQVQAPVLLFHGTEDKAVPHQQSVDFAEAVRRQGGIAQLVSYEGEGHGFVKEANRRDQLEKMEAFLEKYVLVYAHQYHTP